MLKDPQTCEVKSLAKHISRTFNIKLYEAQEIVAFRHNAIGFANLLDELTRKSYKIDTHACENRSLNAEFIKLISPFKNEIAAIIDHRIHVSDSVLKKIADGRYSQISPHLMNLFTTSDEVDFSDSASVIEYLEFIDDSVTRALARRNRSKTLNRVNLWISPWNYAQKLYAYFNFSGDTVDVVVRELDLEIDRPTQESDMLSRPWFMSYMLGYIKFITNQLISAGYSGTIRVTRINSFSAENLYYSNKNNRNNINVSAVFNSLLTNGGSWDWDEDSEGNKIHVGVKVNFG
ncbi:hypothetical protein ACPV5T_18190 [Vibrio astriarenae]